ncbi:MAG: TetR/AcrR family transcriptional regulator [Gammaproteobacteria bacterium]|nr:TetR/AcrR family transcriptional regulator [Gammaproteobacteria bacterium]MDE0366392.1 TetR/AcrR family transcriptional regulator [Gammaproteobacteria bacterium]
MARKARTKELGRPVASDSEATRANILAAAKACFGSTGFRSTSNRDIAEKAGVTAATIYYYFKNKSDLFITVHHEVQAKILGVARKVMEEATSLTEAWIEMSQGIFELHKGDPDIARFNAVVRQEGVRHPEIAEVRYDQEWRDIFRKLAELGISTGEIDPARERELRAVLSVLNFGISHHAVESSVSAHEACIRGLTDLLRGELITPVKT